MADNTTLNAGTGGDVIATDDLAGVKHQLVKVEFGGDGVATMVSTANPLPVQLADGADLALVSAGGALLVDASGATVPISNAGITTIAGAVAGTEMQVDVVASLPAGTNNIGDVDVLTLPALPTGTNNIGDVDVLTAPGTAAEAAALPGVFVVVAADDGTDTQPLQLSAGGDLKITLDSETVVLAAGTNNIGDVDVLSIAAGDNNIGNVDIVTMPNVTIGTMAALVAGTANIGDVDVLTVPAPLSTTGGGTEATALRVTLANDSTGVVSVDDNGGALSVDWAGTAPVTGSGTATGALRVELPNNGTGVLATVGTITNPVTVAGGAANGSPVSGNPNLVAGRASNAIPTDVGADGDAASMWTNRNGAQIVSKAPHVGLNSDPWNLVHEGAQYTSQQTSVVIVAGGASEKIVVTQMQIQAYATTAGTVTIYFGTGAFARGTNRTVFDGEFAPSATLKPGAILTGPFISGANGDDLMITTSAAISVTVSVWYYVVT